MSKASLVIAALLVLLSITGASAQPTAPKQLRWAIVCDPQAQSTGLSDLVFAALADRDNIQLVERDQIAAATKELQIHALLGSAQPTQRLHLGATLKADALLLLRTQNLSTGERGLRVVISECRYGARLDEDYLALSTDFQSRPLDQVAQQIVKIFENAERQLADGIGQLIAVSPLVSNNLTHEFDYLQKGIASLIHRALQQQAGIAVIEVEEADIIRREILAGGDQAKRHVPKLLSGSFLVSTTNRRAPDREARVQLKLNLREAKGVREFTKSVPLNSLATCIFDDISPWVLQRPQRSLAGKTQFRWLVERADTFSAIGFWENAAELREAAILLDPEETQQRIQVVTDYARAMSRRPQLAKAHRHPGSPQYKTAAKKRVDALLAGLGHLEWLIRNQRIDRHQAMDLCERLTTYRLLHPLPLESQTVDGKLVRLGHLELAVAETAESDFLKSAYPTILELPWGDTPQHHSSTIDFMEKWQRHLLNAIVFRIDRPYRTRDDLPAMRSALTELLPDHLPSDNDFVSFLERGYRYWEFGDKFREQLPSDAANEKDWLNFLEQLAGAEHQVLAASGRYGLLHWKWKHRQRFHANKEWAPALLTATNELVRDIAQIPLAEPFKKPYRSRTKDRLYEAALDLSRHIQKSHTASLDPSSPTPTVPSRPSVSKRPANWEHDPKLWRLHGYPQTMGALSFKPIPLRLRQTDGKIVPFQLDERFPSRGGWGSFQRFLKCGDSLDAMWSQSALAVMVKRGQLDIVVNVPHLWISDVVWDGQQLWMGTRFSGIWVVDVHKRTVEKKFTAEDSLPPADQGLKLLPIAPGRILATGSFSQQRRAWCADIHWSSKTNSVNVFHHAKQVATSDRKASGDNLHLTFAPKWIYQEPNGIVLVGRDRTTPDAQRRPLRINVESLNVKVAGFTDDAKLADHVAVRGNPQALHLPNGILEPRHNELLWWSPVGQTHPSGKMFEHLCTNVTNASLHLEKLLTDNGKIYFPGDRWYCIDPETMKTQMLVPGRLPDGSSLPNYDVSSHYGLIGWNSSASRGPVGIYQVNVNHLRRDP